MSSVQALVREHEIAVKYQHRRTISHTSLESQGPNTVRAGFRPLEWHQNTAQRSILEEMVEEMVVQLGVTESSRRP